MRLFGEKLRDDQRGRKKTKDNITVRGLPFGSERSSFPFRDVSNKDGLGKAGTIYHQIPGLTWLSDYVADADEVICFSSFGVFNLYGGIAGPLLIHGL